MNIRFKGLLTTVLAAAMLLAGCGDSSSGNEEESYASKYDSYITYHIDDEISDEDFEKIGGANGQLLERFKKSLAVRKFEFESLEYAIQPQPKDRTVKIYFNNDLNVTEAVLRLSADKNLVEFREGKNPDGELILGNDQIETAEAGISGDKNAETAFQDALGLSGYALDNSSSDESGKDREKVMLNLKFNDDGRHKIKDATEKFAGKDTAITIWVDGKAILSPIVGGVIDSSDLSISEPDIDYNAAKEIAYQLRSGYLPYKISVTECKVSPSKIYNTESSDNS